VTVATLGVDFAHRLDYRRLRSTLARFARAGARMKEGA
jgi:hypothetical protein